VTAGSGGSLTGIAMRFLNFCASPIVLAIACFVASASSAGCGRTDLEEDLVGFDGGTTPDATKDGTPPIPDGTVDVIFPEDVQESDGPFTDAPEFDAPFFDAPEFDVFQPDSGACGDGECDDGETCTSCPLDCGFCPSCGDGTCNENETCSSCPQDCGSCASCPDGFCDDGENCLSCPQDCGECASCGDGTCNGTENCTNCPQDCGMCMGCGDGHCAQGETCISCPADCGSCAFCGNGKCEANEGETCNTCAQDCGACPIAETCEQILTCSFQCFQGGIGGFSLSCLTACDANACTQAQGFANAATDCIIQAFLNGTCGFGGGGGGGALQCAEQACSGPIAACLGSAPCAGSGGSGSGSSTPGG
jgi:hypothetical protein